MWPGGQFTRSKILTLYGYIQILNVRSWKTPLEKNSLFALGPLTGLEDLFRRIHDQVGTIPLILTGIGIAGFAVGKILHSRYKVLKKALQDSALQEENPPLEKPQAKDDFGVLSLPKQRSTFSPTRGDHGS